MAPQLDTYYKTVDSLAEDFIERLRKAVAIPSISAEEARRQDVVKMGHFLKGELEALGAHMEARELGKQPGKEHLDLPPAVIGRYPAKKDESKRTILVYGHYDVQPADLSDGWATDPFTLTVDDKGRMYGRGSTDDKGPVLGWVNVIQSHQKAGIEFPVNLLMCFEGMEEYGSEGLDDFIEAECKPGKFFADADAVCISDNYWLGTEKPCLTYGLRGCSYYSIEVSGPGQDLHSGVFGGTAQEPMTDLVRVMGSLVDTDGNIQIPGIKELVAPLTKESLKRAGVPEDEMAALERQLAPGPSTAPSAAQSTAPASANRMMSFVSAGVEAQAESSRQQAGNNEDIELPDESDDEEPDVQIAEKSVPAAVFGELGKRAAESQEESSGAQENEQLGALERIKRRRQ